MGALRLEESESTFRWLSKRVGIATQIPLVAELPSG